MTLLRAQSAGEHPDGFATLAILHRLPPSPSSPPLLRRLHVPHSTSISLHMAQPFTANMLLKWSARDIRIALTTSSHQSYSRKVLLRLEKPGEAMRQYHDIPLVVPLRRKSYAAAAAHYLLLQLQRVHPPGVHHHIAYGTAPPTDRPHRDSQHPLRRANSCSALPKHYRTLHRLPTPLYGLGDLAADQAPPGCRSRLPCRVPWTNVLLESRTDPFTWHVDGCSVSNKKQGMRWSVSASETAGADTNRGGRKLAWWGFCRGDERSRGFRERSDVVPGGDWDPDGWGRCGPWWVVWRRWRGKMRLLPLLSEGRLSSMLHGHSLAIFCCNRAGCGRAVVSGSGVKSACTVHVAVRICIRSGLHGGVSRCSAKF